MFDLVVMLSWDQQQQGKDEQDQQGFVAAADHHAPSQDQEELYPLGHNR
jgi:hypothetical protein